MNNHLEVDVDVRGRVSLGRAGAVPGGRYRVESDIDGVLTLTPVVSVPASQVRDALTGTGSADA